MRFARIAIAVVAGVLAVIAAIGWCLPVGHRATSSIVVTAPPERVFALIADVGAYPRWRTGLRTVDRLPQKPGEPPRYREHGSDGAILFEVVEEDAPRRRVTRIADPSLPFGGRWTFDVQGHPAGAVLTITEDGEVYNPLMRFIARYMLGHDRTVNQYLGDVASRLGPPGIGRE